jgi:DNA-binding GntR family transcriptional regulator
MIATGQAAGMGDNQQAPTAYDRIRQAIVEGRYRPGTRLIEQRIAAELDLSRTPVREALRALEAEGLVVSYVNRGSVVRPIEVGDLRDLYELRARLESFAAFRAARLRTDAELDTMDAAMRAYRSAVSTASAGDLEGLRAITAANSQFHGAVMDAARHERLAVLLSRATDAPLVYQAFRHFDRAALRRSDLFHRLIRAAIAAGDSLRAERLMGEHIDQGRDVLLEQMQGVESVDVLFDD